MEQFIAAENISLKRPLGTPYQDVTLTVNTGEVLAIRGRNGSGKTALLLTLAGRMENNKGKLTIMGHVMPKKRGHVQRHVGLGLFEGVNDLSDNLTVGYAVAAEFELFSRKITKQTVADYLQEWGLLEKANTRVHLLRRQDLVVLGIALAMVGNPSAIVVDDIESDLTRNQSREVMELLLKLAHEKDVAVMVGCTERDLAEMADQVYHLS